MVQITLVLLLLTYPINIINYWAEHYGVDPELAVEIARLESDLDSLCVGDEGKAIGLYQWHLGSWEHVRRRMGLDNDDHRAVGWESTRTAMYAIGVLRLERWWTAYRVLEKEGHVSTTESERPYLEKRPARDTPDFHNR